MEKDKKGKSTFKTYLMTLPTWERRFVSGVKMEEKKRVIGTIDGWLQQTLQYYGKVKDMYNCTQNCYPHSRKKG
eukprot:13828793-Ditylum_brightwellii.AAC.1